LRIQASLVRSASQWVLSARVVEEATGLLVDFVSVSVPTSGAERLALEPLPAASHSSGLRVSSYRTPPLDSNALAAAWIDDERLVLLFPDEVALYRLESATLALCARHPLSRSEAPVRCPAGLLRAAPGEAAFWVLTNVREAAVLVEVRGDSLVGRGTAQAIPWQGVAAGLRYRPGTNLLEGAGEPVLAMAGDVGVSATGLLQTRDGDRQGELRVGSALAELWPGVYAASAPDPPSQSDAVLILRASGAGLDVRDRIAVEGSIRALAARPRDRACRLLAAIDEPNGEAHLQVIDLAESEP
jgi:hypothetical protein